MDPNTTTEKLSQELVRLQKEVERLKEENVRRTTQRETLMKRRQEILEQLREFGVESPEDIDNVLGSYRGQVEGNVTKVKELVDQVREVLDGNRSS